MREVVGSILRYWLILLLFKFCLYYVGEIGFGFEGVWEGVWNLGRCCRCLIGYGWYFEDDGGCFEKIGMWRRGWEDYGVRDVLL